MTYYEKAKTYLQLEINGLISLQNNLNENFDIALTLLKNRTGKIIITGIGKSGHIAQKIASTLCSTGNPSIFLHPSEASHGDLGAIQDGDVIIILSNSGESKELFDILDFSKRNKNTTISITKNKNSTIGGKTNVCLVLPPHEEACPLGLAPTTSTTMALALGDIISICLYEDTNFSQDSFKSFHPGGKLGKKLFKVSDLMHDRLEVPKININSKISDAIVEMTSKSFGITSVVDNDNKIVGVITDGDIRRNISDITKNVFEIMNTQPKTIELNKLASESLAIMEANKITSLFIINKYNEPIGIIHIHDLLKAGIT